MSYLVASKDNDFERVRQDQDGAPMGKCSNVCAPRPAGCDLLPSVAITATEMVDLKGKTVEAKGDDRMCCTREQTSILIVRISR